ncbi:hypothetical protein [Nostoc sp.]|uniref:hypothetical protein n=1 Tax=Nostoc sp. TaxID=1180 RepID=UPI002FF9CB88
MPLPQIIDRSISEYIRQKAADYGIEVDSVGVIVEAKKNDIEAGLGQCIAQMVAADLFNRSSGQADIPVYGCVTTGEVWQFLQLSQKVALLDQKRYYLDNVGAILAIVQTIVQQFSS